jgi:two-component system, NarL family, response regulator DevR
LLSVFLVEDSEKVRARLREAIKDLPEITIVGEFVNAYDAIAAMLHQPPNVVVLDIKLANSNGIEVLLFGKNAAPQMKFIIFTNYTDAVYRDLFMDAGADYFLDKTNEVDQLLEILSRLAAPT